MIGLLAPFCQPIAPFSQMRFEAELPVIVIVFNVVGVLLNAMDELPLVLGLFSETWKFEKLPEHQLAQ